MVSGVECAVHASLIRDDDGSGDDRGEVRFLKNVVRLHFQELLATNFTFNTAILYHFQFFSKHRHL